MAGSEQGLIMDFTEAVVFATFSKTQSDILRTDLANLRRVLGNLVVLDEHFSGQAKQRINNLINTQHLPMIRALENCYHKIFTKTREMIDSALTFFDEQDEEAVFVHSWLITLQDHLRGVRDDKATLDDEFRTLYNSIANIDGLQYLYGSNSVRSVGSRHREIPEARTMPVNGVFLREFGNAERVVRESIDRLEDFRFDWSEIEELKAEICTYLTKLEEVSGLPLDASRRVNAFGTSDFASRMFGMHSAFRAEERERMEALIESWQGVHPQLSFYDLPHPMSIAEQTAWLEHLNSIMIGIDPDEKDDFLRYVLGYGSNAISGVIRSDFLKNLGYFFDWADSTPNNIGLLWTAIQDFRAYGDPGRTILAVGGSYAVGLLSTGAQAIVINIVGYTGKKKTVTVLIAAGPKGWVVLGVGVLAYWVGGASLSYALNSIFGENPNPNFIDFPWDEFEDISLPGEAFVCPV